MGLVVRILCEMRKYFSGDIDLIGAALSACFDPIDVRLEVGESKTVKSGPNRYIVVRLPNEDKTNE